MARRKGAKITVVGGGSYTWCPKLLSDITQTTELEGSEIVLLDPKIKAAEEVRQAGESIAERVGAKFSFRATKDETSAFRGADFVIITISTGDLPMMRHDLKIPEKYGIFQTVGDTVGPGGWSRALRNVPVFVHLAQQMERYCPRAVVLNYTNPMAALTGAIYEASSLRTVGLCHGVFSNYRTLQKFFGVEEKDLRVNFAGVNHFFWILDFAVKGRPGYPALRRKLKGRTLEQAFLEDMDALGFQSNQALCSELFGAYGYIPYVGDRHTCEFLPGFLTPKESVLKKFKLKRTSVEKRYENRKRARKRTLDLGKGKAEIGKRSRETAVDIMMALLHEKPFTDVVNLPNTGQVENLPLGAVVETLGLVDALGFRPVAAGAMPEVLAERVRPHCVCQLMTLEAAITGDRKLAMESLMLDPICSHLAPTEVRKMGTELMRATKKWLPQFK